MAYIGFVGDGYVGNFLSTVTLELIYPAQKNAGRQATIETAGVVAWYFSTGSAWTQVSGNPYMISAGRGGVAGSPQAAAAGTVYQASAVQLDSPNYQQTSPRFVLAAIYTDSATTYEHPLGNDWVVEGVSIEIAGVRTPLTVNGVSSFTVTNGAYVVTDENSLVIPPSTSYRLIVADNVPAGQFRPAGLRLNSAMSLDGVRQGSTTQSAYLTGAGTFLGSTGIQLCAPAISVAKGWALAGKPPVPLVVGDSIGAGNNDNQFDVPVGGVFGYINRGLADTASSNRMPYCNMCVPGVSYAAVTSTTFAIRKAMLLALNPTYPFTCIISEMGTNAGGGSSAVSGWPAYGTFLKTMGSKPIIQTTMLAKSTANVANIGWTSVANQTIIDFGAYNTWIRATTASDPNLDKVIDMVGVMESTADSGLWAAPTLNTTLAADFTSGTNTLSLNAAPALHSTIVIGAGNAAFKNFGVVTAVAGSGPYTVTLRNAVTGAGYTVAAGYAVNEVNTTDGVHPLTRISETAMSTIVTAKLNGTIV